MGSRRPLTSGPGFLPFYQLSFRLPGNRLDKTLRFQLGLPAARIGRISRKGVVCVPGGGEWVIRPLGTVPGLWNIHKAPAAVPGNQGADCPPAPHLQLNIPLQRGRSWRQNDNQGEKQAWAFTAAA